MCVAGISAIGAIITTRAGVDPLTQAECLSVGTAAAGVAMQYDLAKLSPRAAAWMGLGMAVVGVTAPRLEQYRKTIEAEPAPASNNEPAGADTSPDEGSEIQPLT